MKPYYLHICVFTFVAALFFSTELRGQEQQKQPDILQQIEDEADRLQRLLNLEDWQVFYVDSILKHNFPAMMEEIEKLSKGKVSNTNIYMSVQDRWLDKTDSAYMKIFTNEQWAAYLKTGAAKQQKARAKRRESSMKR